MVGDLGGGRGGRARWSGTSAEVELWTGGSESPQLYSLPNEVWYAVSGDFNGNGSTDLVTVEDATLYYVRSQAVAGVPSFSC